MSDYCRGFQYMTCKHSHWRLSRGPFPVRLSCPKAALYPVFGKKLLADMDDCDSCLQYEAGRHWIIHYIIGLEVVPEGITNYHTHGLMHNYGHMDFQIVFHVRPEIANALLNTMGERVKNGECFQHGDIIPDLGLMDTKVYQFRETGRDVLRLIIPDRNGRFPDDAGCESPFCHQMDRMFEGEG